MKQNLALTRNALLNPCYSDMNEERFTVSPQILPSSTTEQDAVLKLIFAPDPQTGIPRSDLGLLLDKQTEPEVAAYIRENLARPLLSSTGVPDADTALEMARDYGESFEAYANRLRSLCSSKQPSQSK